MKIDHKKKISGKNQFELHSWLNDSDAQTPNSCGGGEIAGRNIFIDDIKHLKNYS